MKILSLSDRVAVVASLCTLGVVVLGAYAFVQPHNAVTSYHASEWNFLAEDLNHVIDSVHSQLLNSESSSRQIALSKVRGGIVSHHIPQTFPELALFYLKLKEHQDVRRFIVLGPDSLKGRTFPETG